MPVKLNDRNSLVRKGLISKSRELEHKKGFRVVIGHGVPNKQEGKDGEFTLRVVKSGLKLFCKYKSHWYIIGEQSLRTPSGTDTDTHNQPSQSTTTINSRTGDLNMGGLINMRGGRSRSKLGRGVSKSVLEQMSPPINASGSGNRGIRFGASDLIYASQCHIGMTPRQHLIFDGSPDGGENHTYIHETANDKLEIVVGGDEMLTLDEANQRVTIEADKLVYKKGSGGEEFSVADSAWAGTILGIRTLGHDAGRVQYTMTTSFATIHADATVRFVAPPSGVVEVYVQAGYLDGYSGRFIYFGLSDNATYNTIGATHEEMVCLTDETDQQVIQNTWVISGLTAGDTYNYWFGAKVSSTVGGDSKLSYGGTGSGHYSPFIMKVTALPTAVADFAVYD